MKRIWGMIVTAALLAGCGGGGGGVGTEMESKLVIGVQAPLAATVLYAVSMTVRLPPGVTVASDPATGEVAARALQVTVEGAQAGARLVPTTSDEPATLKVELANPSGFTVGPVAVIACQVAPGSAPTLADFSIQEFSARGPDGAELFGITPVLTYR